LLTWYLESDILDE